MRNYILNALLMASVASCRSPADFNGDRSQQRTVLRTKGADQVVADPVKGIGEPAKVDGVGKEATQTGTTVEPSLAESSPVATPEPVVDASPAPPPDLRSAEELICQEGPRVANAPKKDDFSNLFLVVCTNGTTNDIFKNAIMSAYTGTGEPTLTVIENTTGDLFLTRLVFVYSVRVPIANPTAVQDLNIYSKFVKGINDPTSKLGFTVESRKPFPGKGSIEELVLHYDLTIASLAGVFDHRRTAMNTYLLKENNRDVMVATEHLLDPETTEYYHIVRGVQVIMRTPDETGTNLIYVNEMVFKNRFDTNRVTGTIINLSKAVAKGIYGVAATK